MKTVRKDFNSLFLESKDEFLSYLQQLVSIPSVKGNETYNAPFGIGPKRALEFILALSKQLGFRTGQVDNCVGWAEYGPTEKECSEYFGVLGHIDVVDVVNDWQYDPFDVTLDEGYLYGRGVLDNKGPIMSTLFALYLIKKQGYILKTRIRIMFGTDEESGSRDIPRYLKVEKPPYAGITPDCKFPIVYGERGLVDLTISNIITDDSLKQIDDLDGEFDHSFLPDQASVTLDGIKTVFKGSKAPSNAPDLADNVLPKLVEYCKSLDGQTGTFFKWINEKIGNQTNGSGLDLDYCDTESGELQLSFYEINITEKGIQLKISIRYPITVSEHILLAQLETQLLASMELTINRRFPSIVRNNKLNFIKQFSEIYEQDTGLDGTPVTTTGVTYARAMPNIVAFGPSFPGQKGIAHKGNEWLKISDWQLMTEIYFDCFIAELC
ncbi:Sapep family Mn(2+)-dependent dipeptidase [Companilactobacillus huachuanensis]|uniref:Sapep family Mn(2+)-dependent dipeptidase n=1 Tax=Companilactobacillus huachuanensis TaxID=2559914 RepID=A0ABW1RQ82_9LACO|nr:Sapep family Mn(2+)-dependent dipeptidase [Companilactobacillus huachuanensis]